VTSSTACSDRSHCATSSRQARFCQSNTSKITLYIGTRRLPSIPLRSMQQNARTHIVHTQARWRCVDRSLVARCRPWPRVKERHTHSCTGHIDDNVYGKQIVEHHTKQLHCVTCMSRQANTSPSAEWRVENTLNASRIVYSCSTTHTISVTCVTLHSLKAPFHVKQT